MAIELALKFSPKVDEKFTSESKTSLVTNKDYEFIGAKSIKIQTVGTAPMQAYGRNTTGMSRYGAINDLSTEVQEVAMEKDESFTFAIDKMDEEETLGALNAGKALARQLREVVIPRVDKYTYSKIAAGAGTNKTETLTSSNTYDALTVATEVLDENEVPMNGRVAIFTPVAYSNLKKDPKAVLETEIGQDMRIKGVVANMDGMNIQKVPAKLLPENQNFIVTHPVATTQAIKLAEYKVHTDVPGISGSLVEGRIYYTAFVLNNKKMAIYSSVHA